MASHRKDRRRDASVDELRLIGTLSSGLVRGIIELCDRDAERTGPDGYATSTGGSATSTISTHSTGSSTESAGLRLATRGVDADPIHTFAVTARREVHEALGCLLKARNAVAAAQKIEDDNRGRQSTITECVNCHATITGIGNDKVRRGRCPHCAQWLYRYDRDWRPGDSDWMPNVAL